MAFRRVGGALLLAMTVGVVASALLAAPHLQTTVLEQDPTEFFASEKEYAAVHPVYTRCASKVNMPEFVKEIRKTCGDVHELQEVQGPCKDMLDQKSEEFGCCWESVMQAYETLDPQAAHKWRLWQGTVSGKGGVTFDSEDCGESMGEKSYSDLKNEVHELRGVVGEQQEEISDIMGALWGYVGYSGSYGASYDPWGANYDSYMGQNYYNYYDPMTGAYFKGDAASLKGESAKAKRGAPTPPLGEEPSQQRKQVHQSGLKGLDAPRSSKLKSWWERYWNYADAAERANRAAEEHYRAAAVHNHAANEAIYAAHAHAVAQHAYGTGYNELMDKYYDLERYRGQTTAATRTANAAAAFAIGALQDSLTHQAAARKAAKIATTAVSATSSGAPLLPMSETVPPVGGTAAFFTQTDPGDKAASKLSAKGVNVGNF